MHFAKRKELKFKSYTCNSNYLTFWGRETYRDRTDQWLVGVRWGEALTTMGMKEFFVLKKMAIILIVVVVTQLSNYRPVDKK